MPTLLHTADWHLGKRLHDFRLLDEQREALARLLDVVDAERPDLIVVAGDLFDAPVPPVAALQLWEWIAHELVDVRGAPVAVIPGNHDHAERIAMNARMARRAGLYVLNDLAACHEPLRIAGIDVVGVPFHKPPHVRALRAAASEGAADPASAAPEPAGAGGDADAAEGQLDDLDYDAAMAVLLERARRARSGGAPSVLVAHAFVEGAGEEPEGEEAILVGGAGGVRAETLAGFDYVALGHLHRPRAVAGPAVRYAGSLFPYAFGEPNAKSVTLVELPEGGGPPTSVREAPLPARRQVRIVRDASFDEVLEEGRAMRADPDRVARTDDYLLVRVTDREPIDHALSRLREVHPHALLEQPAIDVGAEARRLAGDVRTISPEAAFLEFYEAIYGQAPGQLERELLRAVLTGDEVVPADAGEEEG
jgi:exonuclease SbcD